MKRYIRTNMTLSEKIFTINTLLIQIECFLFFHVNERCYLKKKNCIFHMLLPLDTGITIVSDSSEPVPLTHTQNHITFLSLNVKVAGWSKSKKGNAPSDFLFSFSALP